MEEAWWLSPLMVFPVLVITFCIANVLAWWGEALRARHIERQLRELEVSSGPRVGVTLISGFLGSGKTTLLNHILRSDHGKRIAVVENEIGTVSIDHTLIAQELSEDRIFVLKNGCMCCSTDGSRDQLQRVLGTLVQLSRLEEHGVDYVLVESTGLADPAPIIQTLWAAEEQGSGFRLDGVLTVVDCTNVHRHLEGGSFAQVSECTTQIGHADVLLLNKTDLVSPDHLDALEHRLRAMAPLAHVHRCAHGALDPTLLLNQQLFDVARFKQLPRLLPRAHRRYAQPMVLRAGLLNPELLDCWLSRVLEQHGEKLLRLKGLIRLEGEPGVLVLQGTHTQLRTQLEPRHCHRWAEECRLAAEEPDSVLLVVGVGLDSQELQSGLDGCVAQGHLKTS